MTVVNLQGDSIREHNSYNESVIYTFNLSSSENIMNTRKNATILVITNGLTDTHSLRLRLRYI